MTKNAKHTGRQAVMFGSSNRMTSHMHLASKCAYCPDCDHKLPWTSNGFSTCPLCGVEFETPGDGTARRME